MYTIENNLLHLHLGCHPNRDFCHHNQDSKIPIGVADFSNEFLQKLNQITVKRGGRARAAAHTSHFRWQNFKYSLFITSVILNGNMVISIVDVGLSLHNVFFILSGVRARQFLQSFLLKLCHLKWDVCAAARARPPLFTVI